MIKNVSSFYKNIKMKGHASKAIAIAMSAVLLVTSIDLTALAVTGDEDVSPIKNITGVSSLSDEIANQKVTPDATIEDIEFPESLDVRVTYQVEKEIEVETESTEELRDEDVDVTEETNEGDTQESEAPEQDVTSDEQPVEDNQSDDAQSDAMQSADAQGDNTQSDDAQDEGAQNNDAQGDEAQSNDTQDKDIESQPDGEQSAKLANCEYDSITTVYAPMTYCATEPIEEEFEVETLEKDEIPETKESLEVVDGNDSGDESKTETEDESENKTVIIKETVVEDVEEDATVSVKWAIDEENSSKTEFEDLEIGEKYIFVPTITEDGYNLSDGVELPVITVTVEETKVAFEQSVTVDGVVITVTADEGVFPEGATVEARKVTKSEENEVTEAIDEVRDEEKNVAVSYTFDITIYDKAGKEIEPNPEKGSVKVTFKMEEIANENLETDVYHVEKTDDGLNAEGLSVANDSINTDATEGTEVSEKADDEVTVETTGFSFYTVEFTYGELQYVLEGDEKVALSEILEAVEIKENGEITEVVGSDDELFKPVFDEEEKVWYIEALKAFSSEEWLKVTIGGVEYEIVVTDDVTGEWSKLQAALGGL